MKPNTAKIISIFYVLVGLVLLWIPVYMKYCMMNFSDLCISLNQVQDVIGYAFLPFVIFSMLLLRLPFGTFAISFAIAHIVGILFFGGSLVFCFTVWKRKTWATKVGLVMTIAFLLVVLLSFLGYALLGGFEWWIVLLIVLLWAAAFFFLWMQLRKHGIEYG